MVGGSPWEPGCPGSQVGWEERDGTGDTGLLEPTYPWFCQGVRHADGGHLQASSGPCPRAPRAAQQRGRWGKPSLPSSTCGCAQLKPLPVEVTLTCFDSSHVPGDLGACASRGKTDRFWLGQAFSRSRSRPATLEPSQALLSTVVGTVHPTPAHDGSQLSSVRKPLSGPPGSSLNSSPPFLPLPLVLSLCFHPSGLSSLKRPRLQTPYKYMLPTVGQSPCNVITLPAFFPAGHYSAYFLFMSLLPLSLLPLICLVHCGRPGLRTVPHMSQPLHGHTWILRRHSTHSLCC